MRFTHKLNQRIDANLDNLSLFSSLISIARTAQTQYGGGFLRHFKRGFSLVKKHKYKPREAFDIGLFDPEVGPEEFRHFSSKQRLARLQATVNPLTWYSVTEDKGVFYRYCMQTGIPIPHLYAIYHRNTSSWTQENMLPTTEMEWTQFIQKAIHDDFAVKPTNAAYGTGLKIFRLFGSGKWKDHLENTTWDAAGIARDLVNNSVYPGYVLQERVTNHSQLKEISNTEGLQTMRVITHISRQGRCEIIHAAAKLIVGDSLSDNFDKGKTGNLMVRIDIEKGLTTEALVGRKRAPGVKPISRHPETGKDLVGICLPYWSDVCDLVRTASFKLLPIRAVGWDIAITETGPVVIEANMRFDPPNQFQNLDKITQTLEEK